MAALGTENLQHVFRDKLTVIGCVIDNDLNWFLASVTGETKIESVGGSFHGPAFFVGAYY